jgi:ribose-phosphate pyrophosphokinase
VIIVDDMVDTGETITFLSTRLKVAGAQEIFVCASHGLFTDLSSKVIDDSDLSKVFVLDTLPLPSKISSKVEEVSIAHHLAQVILTEHFRSISSVEEKFEIDD